ncbi:uncharacterized protein LOC109720538 isoform X3 [Ananas comosus]|uniref:Uncharacterized protein LOC109720538 isoform X3 n=1 Tax=Ananas comosus TaxID=4615 RepID=A0A6P5G645_ANACO|nr:uncharacterized protein LOC109720538 isoform X3 [Ananas comosus]
MAEPGDLRLHRYPQSKSVDAVRWLPSASAFGRLVAVAVHDPDADPAAASALEIHSLSPTQATSPLCLRSSWPSPSRIAALRASHLPHNPLAAAAAASTAMAGPLSSSAPPSLPSPVELLRSFFSPDSCPDFLSLNTHCCPLWLGTPRRVRRFAAASVRAILGCSYTEPPFAGGCGLVRTDGIDGLASLRRVPACLLLLIRVLVFITNSDYWWLQEMDVAFIARENRKRRKVILNQRRNKEIIQTVELEHRTNRTIDVINSGVASGPSTISLDPANQLHLGLPEYECQFCGALLWYNERIYKSRNEHIPRFSLCCQEGRIYLPLLRETPHILETLLDYQGGREGRKFRDNIRLYNSMFAFTSIGAKVDTGINKSPGPYVFRINGQNHHIIGSLLPSDGHRPKFAQLYIYDTENEVANRMNAFGTDGNLQNIDRNIVADLIQMFDCENEIVKAFRMARDRFVQDDFMPMRLRIIGSRGEVLQQYNRPSCAEIAGLIVGDLGSVDRHRDIIVDHKTEGLKRISDLHPSFMAMQYPILFPYGEDGFRLGIQCRQTSRRKTNSRQYITMREFYAYRMHNRLEEGKTLISGGKLFQQYIVDAFSCVEEERLQYIRRNQTNLRSEIYKGIRDAVVEGDIDGDAIGKRIILPSSFTAGPRYMIQNYQDAIAICRQFGPPDLFITFTCNAQWPEIRDALQFINGQKAEDRPDIVSRVFKLKLEALMEDIKKKQYFGKSIAVTMEIKLLSELSLHQQDCKIKVRICRIWESTAPHLKANIFSLDCLLIDEKGFSMQATIRKQDVEAFKCQITEGSIYLIEKFSIIPNRKKFVAVDRHYMIQINKSTQVTKVQEDSEAIPLYSFNFSTFFEIEKKRYNDAVLTDVIGKIAVIGEITHRYIGQTLTPIRNLEIEDLDKNIMPVTLWDTFATNFDEEDISKKGATHSIIIILAAMTVRTFKEKVHLSTCSASKIYFNLEIPEVLEFLNSCRQHEPNAIQRITYGEQKLISPQEEMCANRKSIAELLSLDLTDSENAKFTCEATIAEIDTSYGWWYKACHNCKTAVKTCDDTFWCSRCNSSEQSPIPWYRLSTIVEDGSGIANFTIFGRLAQDLLRIPAQILASAVDSDKFTIPTIIKTVINQKHIFQIVPDAQRFRTTASTFKVLKIFTLNNDVKGKTFVKCEDQPYSPPNKKQPRTELLLELPPASAIPSSSAQASDQLCEIPEAKKRHLTLANVDKD